MAKGGTLVARTYSSKGYSAALGLFFAVLAAYSIFQSPLFQLQQIHLVGAERLSAKDVLAWTGLSLGENLFDLDTVAIARSLRTHPMVADVRVSRKLPAALRVDLDERRPVAFVPTGDAFWAVDAGAVALFESEALTLALPLVTLEAVPTPTAGQTIEDPRLPLALEFAGALSLKTLASLSEVHVTDDGLMAYTRDGISISLGAEGQMAEKARVLESLLDQVQARRLSVAHIDLRHPRSPVFRDKR